MTNRRTLESLHAQHDNASGPAKRGLRNRARELAAKSGKPVPAWAAERPPGPLSASPAPVALAALSAPVPAVPDALRAWARLGEARVIGAGPGRITLVELDFGETRTANFASAAEALAAVERGAIPWRAVPTLNGVALPKRVAGHAHALRRDA